MTCSKSRGSDNKKSSAAGQALDDLGKRVLDPASGLSFKLSHHLSPSLWDQYKYIYSLTPCASRIWTSDEQHLYEQFSEPIHPTYDPTRHIHNDGPNATPPLHNPHRPHLRNPTSNFNPRLQRWPLDRTTQTHCATNLHSPHARPRTLPLRPRRPFRHNQP